MGTGTPGDIPFVPGVWHQHGPGLRGGCPQHLHPSGFTNPVSLLFSNSPFFKKKIKIFFFFFSNSPFFFLKFLFLCNSSSLPTALLQPGPPPSSLSSMGKLRHGRGGGAAGSPGGLDPELWGRGDELGTPLGTRPPVWWLGQAGCRLLPGSIAAHKSPWRGITQPGKIPSGLAAPRRGAGAGWGYLGVGGGCQQHPNVPPNPPIPQGAASGCGI